ncbi:MAG: hypothetical protein EU549_00585 [Promethearchaeota archaeon]|nr:MAG: hypothetical protein EU549_00585 [Candidatus Lokiarchaeota archaeon]
MKNEIDFQEIDEFFLELNNKNFNLRELIENCKNLVDKYEKISSNKMDILGQLYEIYLDKNNDRKNNGIFYTPNYIVEYIVENTVDKLFNNYITKLEDSLIHYNSQECENIIKNIIDIKILDPACGSGVFLIVSFRHIWAKYMRINDLFLKIESNIDNNAKSKNLNFYREFIESLKDWKTLFELDKDGLGILKIIFRHIHGVDSDLNAIKIAKFNFYHFIIQFIKDKLKNKIKFLKRKELFHILSQNLIFGDSLIDFKPKVIMKLLQNNYSNDLETIFNLRRSFERNEFNENTIRLMKNTKNRLNKEIHNDFKRNYFDTDKITSIFKENNLIFYYLEFWYAFFNDNGEIKPISDRGFEICIGNPPYYTEVRGYKDIFRIYKKSPAIKQYYEQKMDIFYFFIERGLDLLRHNGYLGFIVMDYWKTRTFGRKLRNKIVIDAVIQKIVDFNEFTVFNEAKGQHNSILILQKKKRNKIRDKYKVKFISVNDKELLDKDISDALKGNNLKGIDNINLILIKDNGKIRLEDVQTIEILDKLHKKRNYFISNDKINQGLVIPQNNVRRSHLRKLGEKDFNIGDGIFILSEGERKELGLTAKEKALLKPFYTAENLDSYFYNDFKDINRKWILYITKAFIKYDKNEINTIFQKTIEKEEALNELLPELKSDYPNIINHLNKFQAIITSDKKPFGLHRPRKKDIFETNYKIISVRKTKYPKFALVPIVYYMDQSVYYISIKDESIIRYLVGLFNSKLSFFFFKKSKTHGNQLQIDKSVIKRFPIHISDNYKSKVNQIVKKIIELKRLNNNSQTSEIKNLLSAIDAIFFKIYEINANEQEYIFEFLDIKRSERDRIKKIDIDKELQQLNE